MHTILLASNNRGKIREIEAIFGPTLREWGMALRLPSDVGISDWFVDETGDTFAENAVLKASTLAKATGMAAIGEDSGLCVDALGGAPGVRSARWVEGSDSDRNEALLALLRDVPQTKRSARFACAIALDRGPSWPAALLFAKSTQVAQAEGTCEGEIAFASAGEGGFGYDPVFLLPTHGATFAQIGDAEKNRLSHRRKALEALAQKIFRDKLPEPVTDSE